MKSILIVTMLSVLLSPLSAFAQSQASVSDREFASELDNYIRQSMTSIPELPSVAMVVVRDDKPIFMQAYGLAKKESGTKADSDTLYYIASSTKSFMALAAAILDREGKIKLSEPAVKYAPGVTFKQPIPEKITIQNLLTHSSGLRNSPLVWRTAFSGESDDQSLARAFAEATTFDEKNYGKYAYTNLGYNIYGVLLQMSLKKRWQDVIHEKVLKPLGMKQTYASVTKARANKLTVADSYLYSPESDSVIRSPIEKQDNNMQAAGGMVMSLNDAARWLRVNMNEGKLDGKQIFPADVMQLVHTGLVDTTRDQPPFTGNGKYGLGWQIGKYRDENVIYHHGGYSGWSNHISYMPDKKLGVGVFINESTAGGRIGHLLATYAYDRLLGKDTTENYVKLLQSLSEQYGKMKQQRVASFRSRASRTSQLTRPLPDYVGRYTNDILGNIDIAVSGSTLSVRMGYLNGLSTPFTEKETIRIELVPGEGEVIQFNTGSDGKIESLRFADMTFARK